MPRVYAIGFLDVLLDYAADVAPQGDIGKWSDGVIALACEWQGDPKAFVDAFVDSGWLDKCARRRLVIHDLEDHAPSWWKMKLRNLGLVDDTGKPLFFVAVPVVPSVEALAEGSSPLPSTPSTPPPSPPASTPVDSGSPAKKGEGEVLWKSIELDLRKLEVNDASTALVDAKKNGLAPQAILEIIAFYKASPPGKWKPGGLHYRIRKGTPGLPADKGWPQPTKSAAVGDEQAREASAARAKQSDVDARQKEVDKQAIEQLERDFGTCVDSLPRESLEALLSGKYSPLIPKLRKPDGHKSPLVRQVLLKAIAEKEGFAQ